MSGHTADIPRISWVMWSRRIPGLSPTQKLVLGELARLADWRGETICPVAHLVRTTGRTRRSVHYALSGLVSRGLLDCRRRWHRNGRLATSARRMVALAGVIDAAEIKAVDAAKAEGKETSEAENALVNPAGPKITVDDNEGLSGLGDDRPLPGRGCRSAVQDGGAAGDGFRVHGVQRSQVGHLFVGLGDPTRLCRGDYGGEVAMGDVGHRHAPCN